VTALVGVLKPTPTTDIVGEDALEVRVPAFDLGDHAAQAVASPDVQPAFPGVLEDAHDLHVPAGGILLDPVELILGGILLMLGGHAHVCRCWRDYGVGGRELGRPAHDYTRRVRLL